MLIKESNRHKAALSAHHGLYQFKGMPFGLRNVAVSFQRSMDIILSSFRFKYVMVYLDGIMVFSRNVEEHQENLETVLSLLQNSSMTIKLNRCFFLHDAIEYLGHIVKSKNIYVALKTIDAVQQMTTPEQQDATAIVLGSLQRIPALCARFHLRRSPAQQETEEICKRQMHVNRRTARKLRRAETPFNPTTRALPTPSQQTIRPRY